MHRDAPSRSLDRAACADLELLLSGALAPLDRYLDAADVAAVRAHGRLADGTVCAVPLTLTLPPDLPVSAGDRVLLRDEEGLPLAVVTLSEVRRAADDSGALQAGGRVEGLGHPGHVDFPDLRLGPSGARAALAARGGDAVAYVARDVLHRPALTAVAAAAAGAPLLLVGAVGGSSPTDLAHHVRVRCWLAAAATLPDPVVTLAPLRGRAGDWRALVTDAVLARSCGCRRLLADADAVAAARRGAAADAVDLDGLLADAGVDVVALPVDGGAAGTAVADLLDAGREVPADLSPPVVVAELRRLRPPPRQQGFTVLFTGLSGSGKSTVAKHLAVRLLEHGRRVTLLDGDVVRRHLSAGLGFSREDRDRNVRRIGFVAAEITRHGGAAVCAPIAPYDATRKAVRTMVSAVGRFVLVHVATPLAVCEARDVKGLYARARAGQLSGFTGVDDPYEVPADADLVVDTAEVSADEAADRVLALLREGGLL